MGHWSTCKNSSHNSTSVRSRPRRIVAIVFGRISANIASSPLDGKAEVNIFVTIIGVVGLILTRQDVIRSDCDVGNIDCAVVVCIARMKFLCIGTYAYQ